MGWLSETSDSTNMKLILAFVLLALAVSADAASSSASASGSAAAGAGKGKCTFYSGKAVNALTKVNVQTCKTGEMCAYMWVSDTAKKTLSIVQACDTGGKNCKTYKAKNGQCRHAAAGSKRNEVYCSNSDIPYTKKKPYSSCPAMGSSSASSTAAISLFSVVAAVMGLMSQ